MNIGGYEIGEDSEYSNEQVSEYSIVLIMSKFGLCPSKKQAEQFEKENYTEKDLMRHIRCELWDKYGLEGA
jgi:hypothetical protein